MWLDPGEFRAMVSWSESSSMSGDHSQMPTAQQVADAAAEAIESDRGCLVCRKPMAKESHEHLQELVIDTCRGHGAWFDRGELARAIELDSRRRARERNMGRSDRKERALDASDDSISLGEFLACMFAEMLPPY